MKLDGVKVYRDQMGEDNDKYYLYLFYRNEHCWAWSSRHTIDIRLKELEKYRESYQLVCGHYPLDKLDEISWQELQLELL